MKFQEEQILRARVQVAEQNADHWKTKLHDTERYFKDALRTQEVIFSYFNALNKRLDRMEKNLRRRISKN